MSPIDPTGFSDGLEQFLDDEAPDWEWHVTHYQDNEGARVVQVNAIGARGKRRISIPLSWERVVAANGDVVKLAREIIEQLRTVPDTP